MSLVALSPSHVVVAVSGNVCLYTKRCYNVINEYGNNEFGLKKTNSSDYEVRDYCRD